MTTTQTQPAEFGTTRSTADQIRGITHNDDGVSGLYTAFAPTFCRDFKSLRGAVAFMARMGYDAHGRRVA